MDATFTCVLDARARLGECPIWSTREHVLYWVDIFGPSLNRFDPATGRNTVMPMPADIGSFALRKPAGFVVALRTGLFLAGPDGAVGRKIADPPYDPATDRFNDGRCDPRGRFFVGTMNEPRVANTAGLWRLDPDGGLHRVLSDIMISNGLAWSPDGATMYHADTPTHTVRAFDYNLATGMPARPREFVRWTGETDRPDGGTVDSEGNYWSAFFRGGKVVQVSPQGRTLAEYPVPAMCPTMCAFGGPDLCTLYVTSARMNRDDAELARLPHSGGIFAMRVRVPGLPEHAFAG